MELGSKMPFYKRCADGQKVWRVSANYKLEWPQEVELVHVDVLAKAGGIWREKGYLTPCWTRWTKMEWLKVPPTEGIPELRSIWPEGIAPLPDLPGHTVLCNEIELPEK